jgi:four helix bundle protein
MVEEELDETCHWLEIIMEVELLPANKLNQLYQECIDLYKIIVKSIISTRKHLANDGEDSK